MRFFRLLCEMLINERTKTCRPVVRWRPRLEVLEDRIVPWLPSFAAGALRDNQDTSGTRDDVG